MYYIYKCMYNQSSLFKDSIPAICLLTKIFLQPPKSMFLGYYVHVQKDSRLVCFCFVLFFFKIYSFVLFLVVLGLCCCTAFSLVVVSGGYSLVFGAQASHCSGFSCWGARALGHEGFSSCGFQAPEQRF